MGEEKPKKKKKIEKKLQNMWDIAQKEIEKGFSYKFKIEKGIVSHPRFFMSLSLVSFFAILLIYLFVGLIQNLGGESFEEISAKLGLYGLFFILVAIIVPLFVQASLLDIFPKENAWTKVGMDSVYILEKHKKEFDFLDFLYLNYVLILDYTIPYFDLDKYLELKHGELSDVKILDFVLEFYLE